MKIFIRGLAVLLQCLDNALVKQWEVDKIEITEEDIDYYNNYYLKGIEHPDYKVG